MKMNEERGKAGMWERPDINVRIFAESIADTIREPLVILEEDLKVVIANPAFYRKFPVNKSETEGRRIYDLGNGQWNIPGLRKLLETIISGNEAIEDFEVEHDFPDLGNRIMLLNARRIKQEGGTYFILLAIEDITDAVESHRALEESEALYNGLVEEINSIIIEVSPEGVISFFNRFAEKVFGYSRNELIGKKLVGTILPENDSEGKDNSGLVAGMFRNPSQYYLNENIGIHKDGREVFFSWSARLIRAPMSENDTILIDGNDMTYIRQSKRQARQALEIIQGSGIPMVLLDSNKTCLLANEPFAELAGRKRGEQIEGLELTETALPDDLIDRLSLHIDEAFQTGKKQVFEVDYNRRSLLIRVESQYKKDDKIGETGLFFYDITVQKRAEKEREKLISELQDALAEVKKLSDLLPICSFCKKIRDDKGYWNQIESYIHEHSEAKFSHGICQECAKKHYPDMNLYDE